MNIKKTIKVLLGYIFYKGYYRFVKPKGNRILIYHAFGSKLAHDSYGISISPLLFEEHLKVLAANYTVVPLNYSIFNKERSRDTVSITIDDGYKDNLVAIKLLQKYEMPFTLYVSTGLVDTEGYLSSLDLQNISRIDLCTLGVHTKNHVHLAELPPEEQYKELKDSQQFLEDIIGKKVTHFSYPYGSYNHSSRKIAESLYEIISTSHIGINEGNCDRKMLKRIEIIATDSTDDLKQKIDGFYDYLAFFKK